MKRFLSALLTLSLSLLLMAPVSAAAEHRPGDTYTRVLASNGTVTVGVRTTYGGDKWVNGAVIRDDREEFVYTQNGVDWIASGPASSDLWYGRYDGTQFLVSYTFGSTEPRYRSADGIQWSEIPAEERDALPTISIRQAGLYGYQFLTDEDGNVWAENDLGQRTRLSEFDTFLKRGYLPTYVVAYPVPDGIRVTVYAQFDYTADEAYTYSVQELDRRLANVGTAPDQFGVTWNGTPVAFPIPLYLRNGCAMVPLRAAAESMGYSVTYDAGTRTAVCTKPGSSISVTVGSTRATVDGEAVNALAVPAELKGSFFCVPLRFFAGAAGADIAYDAAGHTFQLTAGTDL